MYIYSISYIDGKYAGSQIPSNLSIIDECYNFKKEYTMLLGSKNCTTSSIYTSDWLGNVFLT